MKLYKKITDLIGKTPLLELQKFEVNISHFDLFEGREVPINSQLFLVSDTIKYQLYSIVLAS